MDMPRPSVPRLLVNNQFVGPFSGERNRVRNDVALIGDIVHSVQEIAELCSWTKDLSVLLNDLHDVK